MLSRFFKRPKTLSYPALLQDDDVHDSVQAERIKRLEKQIIKLDQRVSITEKLLGIEVKNITHDAKA